MGGLRQGIRHSGAVGSGRLKIKLAFDVVRHMQGRIQGEGRGPPQTNAQNFHGVKVIYV